MKGRRNLQRPFRTQNLSIPPDPRQRPVATAPGWGLPALHALTPMRGDNDRVPGPLSPPSFAAMA